MDKYHDERFTRSDASNIKDSLQKSRAYHLVRSTHSFYILKLIAGISQILLGVGVITVSVLGFLQPLWLSTAFSMIASISTMIGLYLVYITVTKEYNRKSLLRNAIKRIMESRN